MEAATGEPVQAVQGIGGIMASINEIAAQFSASRG
jgi:hypothetical protein